MARPRTPTALLELRGAFRNHPSRLRERKNEPLVTIALPDPPHHLTPSVASMWREMQTRGFWLTSADRFFLEIAARLMADQRRDRLKSADTSMLIHAYRVARKARIFSKRSSKTQHSRGPNRLTYNLTTSIQSFTLAPGTPKLLVPLNPLRKSLLLQIVGANPAAFKFQSAPVSATDGITLGSANTVGGQGGSFEISDSGKTLDGCCPVDAIYAFSQAGTTVIVSEGTVSSFL